MKRFKIWETYTVSGWHYVKAETLEEAERYFVQDSADVDLNDFDDEEWEYESTDWKSLQETEPK